MHFEPPFGYYDAEASEMSMAQFRPADTVDFIVVGIGAAGGVMAKELATAGFRVVALEQGPWRHEKDFKHDEVACDVPRGTHQQSEETAQHFSQNTGRRRSAAASRGVRLHGGRRIGPFHHELLALPSGRFSRTVGARSRARRGFAGLAHHLRRSRAVLHQGRMGPRNIRPRRLESV